MNKIIRSAGCFIFNLPTNKYVLVRSKRNNEWGFPKGHFDPTSDKTLLDTALRETMEETNLKVTIPDISINTEMNYKLYNGKDKSVLLYLGLINYSDEEALKGIMKCKDDEVDQYVLLK